MLILSDNPMLILNGKQHLEYTADLLHEYEAAFAGWLGDPDGEATYAQIAARAFHLEPFPAGVG